MKSAAVGNSCLAVFLKTYFCPPSQVKVCVFFRQRRWTEGNKDRNTSQEEEERNVSWQGERNAAVTGFSPVMV